MATTTAVVAFLAQVRSAIEELEVALQQPEPEPPPEEPPDEEPLEEPPLEPPPDVEPEPEPEPEPVEAVPTSGLLISAEELAALPMSGLAWLHLRAIADGSLGSPDLTDQDNKHCVKTLAVALVAARTGDQSYHDKACQAVMSAIGTERIGAGNSILSLGRQLGSYVVAAQLIGLDGEDAVTFGTWLAHIRTQELGGHGRWKVLQGTAEDSSNNWGAFAHASLIAAHRYLGDEAGLERSWAVYRSFTGDLSDFQFPPTSSTFGWDCPGAPWTPVNVSSECAADKLGAIPQDAGRSGDYPTLHKGYMLESMQGLAFQAEILERAGYPAWERLRIVADFATRWHVWNDHSVGYHLSWWYNARLGMSAPTQPAGYGRLMGWTDWLYHSQA